MSTNRNIVEMVEAIRKGTGGSNSADGVDGTYMADVLSEIGRASCRERV